MTAARTLVVVTVGFAVQFIGLATFVTIANTSWGASGKPLVLGGTILAMALLLLIANRPFQFSRAVVQSVFLAFGYLVAWHLLGVLYLPGLLKDFAVGSSEHLHAIAAVSGLLFCLYLAGSVAAAALRKGMRAAANT